MSQLFTPIQFREVKIRNRIFVSPMCQYSAVAGVPNNWHLVHLGSRAVGRAGLVVAEATSVSPEGRISPGDLGLWNDEQAQAFKPIVEFIHSQGAVSGIQLAHAGRKASTLEPWEGGGPIAPTGPRGWQVVAPSAIAYKPDYQTPKELDEKGLDKIITDFERSADLALKAGFRVIEVHAAHGYLLHQFLSPLSNQRKDNLGGSLENRMRFPLRVVERVRRRWPQGLPLFVRISATDWADGGWNENESVVFCRELKRLGVDLVDVSTGGLSPDQKIPVKALYQVPFAEKIRTEAEIATGAVGLITKASEAESILVEGKADAIFMAREFLRDPYWPLHAAREVHVEIDWPSQYERAKPHRSSNN